MREVLLVGIVAALCCVALIKPKLGLLSYVWFALMRPDVLAFAAGPRHLAFSAFLAYATLIGSIRYVGALPRLLKNPFSFVLILLQLVFFISTILAVDPALSEVPYDLQLRVVCMALLQIVLLQDLVDLKRLLIVTGLSVGAIGLKYGGYGILQGGVTFHYGYAGFLEDNNNFALALVMATAICWYARFLTQLTWVKAALIVAMLASAAAVVMANSRGGFLSLSVVMLLIVLRSKRRFAAILVLGVAVGGTIFLIRDAFLNRMATMKDPMEEASARSRIIVGEAGLRMAKDYPLIGVGFGGDNERALINHYTDVGDGDLNIYLHNTYLQVLVDSGAFAALLYIILLFGAIFWLRLSARRAKKYYPDLAPIPLGIQTALIGYAIGSCFLSRVTFDLTYMLLMATGAWYAIERQFPNAQIAPVDIDADALTPAESGSRPARESLPCTVQTATWACPVDDSPAPNC